LVHRINVLAVGVALIIIMHHDDANFNAGFASGDYGYFVPYTKGAAHPGAGPDLTATDGDLKGFFGGGYGYVHNRAMFGKGRPHSAAPPSGRCSCST